MNEITQKDIQLMILEVTNEVLRKEREYILKEAKRRLKEKRGEK